MSRTKKQSEPDKPPGAPVWMVTFSDCMTLLLTFFVLLLSFSSFDEEIFQKLKVIFSDALPAASLRDEQGKDAFLATQQIQHTEDISKGSEKPTLETGQKDNLMQETPLVNFHNRKVFLIPSEKIFWGKGTAISAAGREVLARMALFLRKVPSRVVISENGQPEDSPSVVRPPSSIQAGYGLHRAWAVTEFFVKKQGLDKNRFSISEASTVDPDARSRSTSGLDTRRESRTLEIVLLERSIYH